MRFSFQVFTQRVDYLRYAQAYLDEAFDALVRETTGIRERTLLQQHVLPDGREHKRVRVVPELHVPAMFAHLAAGKALHYDEITLYDPATRTAEVCIETPAGHLLAVTGLARCSEQDGGVLLRFDGEVLVRVPGLGTLAERLIVAEVERRHREVAALLQSYLDGNAVHTAKSETSEPGAAPALIPPD